MAEKAQEDFFPGWIGHASRLEAEKLLADAPEGTFVLREGDELTERITEGLAKKNYELMHSYVLTVTQKGRKISDYWVVHTKEGWTLYQDNPNLHDKQYRFYPSLQHLLENIKMIAAHALKKK